MTPEADRGDELIASSTPESKGEALSAINKKSTRYDRSDVRYTHTFKVINIDKDEDSLNLSPMN